MTQSSTRFISYRPCQSNKKIAFADGTIITTDGKGDIKSKSNFEGCFACAQTMSIWLLFTSL